MATSCQPHTLWPSRPALLALAGFGLFLGSAPAVQAQYSVDPVIVQFSSSDSVRATATRIKNDGSQPLDVRLYVNDFDQDETGNHNFLPAGQGARSCESVLRVTPDAITVPPGESRYVNISFEPWQGQNTCWSMVFAETLARVPTGMRVRQRIGVKVYGLAAEGEPSGGITIAAIETGQDGPQLVFEFENPGAWPVRPVGSVEIRDYQGQVLRSIDVRPFSVLPDQIRKVSVPVGQGLPAGDYLAVPMLDFGADYLAGAQVAFSVP
ncbi:MAG: hypothetical protein ABFS14_08955 [Gemmatimonadota bacterium]